MILLSLATFLVEDDLREEDIPRVGQISQFTTL